MICPDVAALEYFIVEYLLKGEPTMAVWEKLRIDVDYLYDRVTELHEVFHGRIKDSIINKEDKK